MSERRGAAGGIFSIHLQGSNAKQGKRRMAQTNLFLCHVTVELGRFESAQAENDTHPMGFFLLAEEDDNSVRINVFAEIE